MVKRINIFEISTPASIKFHSSEEIY